MTFENALSENDELNDDIMLSSSSANVSQKTNQRSKTLPRLPSSEQGITKPKQKTQSLSTSPTAITRPHSLWKHGEHSPRHMSVPAPRIQQATLLQPTFFPTSLQTSELPDMDNTDHQWPQASQHKLYFNTDPQSLNNVFDNPSENQSLPSNVVSSHQEKNSAPDAIENNSKMWQPRGGNQGSWADFPTSFNGVYVSNEKPWNEKAVVHEDDNIHASKRERSSSHSSISSNSSEDDIAETEESVWKINDEQKAYYLNQFRILQPAEMGVVSGQKAREFFLKSGLGMDVLSKIWNLADLDADGALDFDEFCIAMHIVVAVRHGLEVPQFLPLHLVPRNMKNNRVLPYLKWMLTAKDYLQKTLDSPGQDSRLIVARMLKSMVLRFKTMDNWGFHNAL
ncbi:ralBP1-associated Eps domain-containing protein 1-like [Xenia sp. Carnegie-2017]|uniref:ralBP1-associated Eps domain-containing protein 1-like n=1 Tax=Xenia sp. Carnegie-2017 TaxID=2897299 RepID=UPI001F0346A5|nr:ralBP1-associated Eps domain-containing protein 1-like [Xenia sp. Carnegie-2017]XP_046848797.1 ralBP1-associated Eps domain-containing protein 1-like [Xenia sp. Carnegie-2017]XP_046848798.1 ralBP1-associated Eps domain-containing protein 1-like [Xenia sp. Carnegie-2017]XP_046848799.1 ralBP1-associated Eps domain-containing protein 1-like [Xenia sp. Carnegie-2017]